MILGIGIDLIETDRFSPPATAIPLLKKVFTAAELSYCQKSPNLFAQRAATRFAAKEAFLKALNSAYPELKLSLPQLSKLIEVKKNGPIPYLEVKWPEIARNLPPNLRAHLSLTHTPTLGNAIVIIEKIG